MNFMPFIVTFAALWGYFFMEGEFRYSQNNKQEMKYKKTRENIERLEKWHDENP